MSEGAILGLVAAPLALSVLSRRVDGSGKAAVYGAGAACAFAGALCLRAAFYVLGFSAFLMF